MRSKHLRLGLASVAGVVALSVTFNLLFPSDDHFVNTSDATPAPLPTHINEMAWQWQVPEESWGVTVLAGVAGPVAVLHDGVIALDGVSGEELWGYRFPESDDTANFSAGITPDGERTVIGRTHGNDGEERVNVIVVDTLTGKVENKHSYDLPFELQQLPSLEGPVPDVANLSDHTWIEPAPHGFVARDITTGDAAWEFEPDPECTMVAGSVETNLLDTSIGSTGEAFLVPLLCGQSNSATDETDEWVGGELVSLGAETGEPVWSSPKDIELRRSFHSAPGTYDLRFDISPDEDSFVARTANGRTLFDLETGEALHKDITDFFPADTLEYYFSFDHESIFVNMNSKRKEHPLKLREVEFSSGNTVSETELPEEYYARSDPTYASLRSADDGSFTGVPLEDGALVLGCDHDCLSEPVNRRDDDGGVLALFVPWGTNEVAAAVELPGFTSGTHSTHDRLLPVPGGMVAYQETGSSGYFETLIGLG